MGLWEIITLGGTMGTVLGLFLTLYAVINNKNLKEQSRLTRESLAEIIKEETRLTREFLAEILDRIDRRAEERHQEILSKV